MKRIVAVALLLLLAVVVWWQFLRPRAKLQELRRASDAVVAACVQGDQAEFDQRMREFDRRMRELDSAEWAPSEAALENRLIELGCRAGEIGSPEAVQHAAGLALDALETACADRQSSEITRRREEAAQVISKLRGKDFDFWMRMFKEVIALCPEWQRQPPG